MEKKIKVKLWKRSWAKMLACLKSKETRIDKDGDWRYVYERDEQTGKVKKNKKGKPIKIRDTETGKPIIEVVDYDHSIDFDEIIKEIERQFLENRVLSEINEIGIYDRYKIT